MKIILNPASIRHLGTTYQDAYDAINTLSRTLIRNKISYRLFQHSGLWTSEVQNTLDSLADENLPEVFVEFDDTYDEESIKDLIRHAWGLEENF